MKTVLTIDDSSSIRQMVSMTLSGAGFKVLQAADGAEGLRVATANPVDAALTDLNMPIMNGIEFTRAFRGHPAGRGVPIVLLTTESDDTMKSEAKSAGATGFAANVQGVGYHRILTGLWLPQLRGSRSFRTLCTSVARDLVVNHAQREQGYQPYAESCFLSC